MIERRMNQIIQLLKTNVLYYESAMKQLTTYIDILDNELKTLNGKTPINYVTTRVKKPESIIEKLKRKKLPLNMNSIDELTDIVGARIVVDFIDNIYVVIDKLKENKNIKIINEKDYIKNHKDSGYRGYHIIIEIPTYVNGLMKNIKCEIQIRTLAIDSWASNEHKLNYKKSSIDQETKNILKETAEEIWNVDTKMNELYKKNKNDVNKNTLEDLPFINILNNRRN